jgi:hypothetical protein
MGGVRVWPVGSSFLKGETYGWLRLERPTLESGSVYPPGYIHLPDHAAGEEVCRQLTAEQLVARRGRNGYRRLEWVKTRERNEALDCRVYARAAAAALGMNGWGQGRWQRLKENLAAQAPAVRQTSASGAFLSGASMTGASTTSSPGGLHAPQPRNQHRGRIRSQRTLNALSFGGAFRGAARWTTNERHRVKAVWFHFLGRQWSDVASLIGRRRKNSPESGPCVGSVLGSPEQHPAQNTLAVERRRTLVSSLLRIVTTARS